MVSLLSDEKIVVYGCSITVISSLEEAVLEQLLKLDSDIIVSADKEFLRYWQLRLPDPLDDVESFVVNDAGCISSIGQKVESLNQIEAQYIGLMRFKGAGLDALNNYLDRLNGTTGFDKMYMTDLLMSMIKGGVCLTPSYHQNDWLEIDCVDDHTLAEKILRAEISLS